MNTQRNNIKKQYERDYPFRVDLPDHIGKDDTPNRPPGLPLDEIGSWCNDTFPRDEWKSFGARFYFKSWEAMTTFSVRWIVDGSTYRVDRTPKYGPSFNMG